MTDRWLGYLVLQMEQIRGMMSLMIALDVSAQRLGLIRGALHQRDRQSRAGGGQCLGPGRGGAILSVLLQQGKV